LPGIAQARLLRAASGSGEEVATTGSVMFPQRRAWGAFGAFSLSGELPRERTLAQIEAQIAQLTFGDRAATNDVNSLLADLRSSWLDEARRVFAELEPWETVCVARHPQRPVLTDFLDKIVHDFCELHGDGVSGEDPAIITGLGRIAHHDVMIVGHNRGRDLKERVGCRFGCAHPEGYRKALAKMRLAQKFRLPVVSLIDTPGAFPGMEAEQRGIARAIATNLAAMPNLRTPIVSVVIGEGGSGGALGIGICDRMAMLEHSIFSVISPEGCAAILWRRSEEAREAAAALRLRAGDLRRMGLVDHVIPEPVGGAHRDPARTAAAVESFVVETLDQLVQEPIDRLLERRYRRLRSFGAAFTEVSGLPGLEAPSARTSSTGNDVCGAGI